MDLSLPGGWDQLPRELTIFPAYLLGASRPMSSATVEETRSLAEDQHQFIAAKAPGCTVRTEGRYQHGGGTPLHMPQQWELGAGPL